MRIHRHLLKWPVFILVLVFAQASWAAQEHIEYRLSAGDREAASPPQERYRIQPDGDFTWGTDPGGVIYDHRYWHPRGYPYNFHPATPRTPCRPCQPKFSCPPCYPPGAFRHSGPPWYKDGMPAPAGRLSVLVEPLHAEAFIDGVPLKRNEDLSYEAKLLPGTYLIEARANGYQSRERTVSIRGGEFVRLAIRLDPDENR